MSEIVTTGSTRERVLSRKGIMLLLLPAWASLAIAPATPISGAVVSAPARQTVDRDAIEAKALHSLYSLDFDDAESGFVELTEQDPDNPRFWNLLASSIWLRILYDQEKMNLDAFSGRRFAGDSEDAIDPETEARLRRVLAHALAAADAILETDPDNIDALYAAGIANGTLASFEATVKRSYLAANGAASRARKQHMRVLELNNAYNDARLTIGAYDYTVGQLPLLLRAFIGIIGIRGDKEGGIQQLEYAAQLGERGRTNAKVVLIAVYNREEKYDRSLALLDELHAEYPRNFMFELEKASVYQRMEEWDDAVNVYESVMSKVRTGRDGYDRLEPESVLYKLAEAHIHDMDNDAALEVFGEILASPDSTETLEARSRLWMGKIYDSRGERMHALDQYGRVLTLEAPDDLHREANRYIRRPFDG